MDPANDGRYVAEAMRCHACAAKQLADQDMASSSGAAYGIYWRTDLRR